MKKVEKKNMEPDLTNVKTVVLMEGLSSLEHFSMEGEEPRRILEDINLTMGRAESWGIFGRSVFEIKLLLEIMANIKPYHGGRAVLVERGMMRNKRVILEHLFYIGSPTMLYDNMNVLEYLMFATGRQGLEPLYRQEQLFQRLIESGLGHISLTSIGELAEEEKAVIILLVAAYSDSVMIVFNFPEYDFDEVLSGAIGKISELIRSMKKTLILGSRDCLLIEKACSHTAYVTEGKISYQGTVEKLRLKYDRILLTVQDSGNREIMEALAPLLPRHNLSIIDDSLLISDRGEIDTDPLYIYKKITDLGFAPQQITVNSKTVQNAYEEIDRRYDLQKQLFQ